MKILLLSLDNSDKIIVGGKHIHQILFKSGLEVLGHSVKAIFPKRSVIYLGLRLLLTLGYFLRVVSRDRIYSLTLAAYCASLKKQIKNEKPDLIFVQDPVSACACSEINGAETSIFMTLHGYLGRESVNYGSYSDQEKKKVLAEALKYELGSLELVDGVVCVDSKISEYLKQDLKYRGSVMVLENAVDPNKFGQTSERKLRELRNQRRLSSEGKVVLIPRRLVRKNGVDIALRACALLKKSSAPEGFHFLVLGSGPESSNLQELKRELGLSDNNISFLGSIPHDQIAAYYDMADVVLVPSVIRDGVEEATSLSMLEGMAAKKIVIVSAIGGMKDVIRNGENGFSFPQGDANALSCLLQGLKDVAPAQLDEIRSQAYKDVCDRHHYKEHAKAFIQFVSRTQGNK